MFKAPVDSDSDDEDPCYAARDDQVHPPQASAPPMQQHTSQSPGLTNPALPDDSSGGQAVPPPQQQQHTAAAPAAGPMQRLFGRWSRTSSGGDTSANSQPSNSSPRATSAQPPCTTSGAGVEHSQPSAAVPSTAEPTQCQGMGSGGPEAADTALQTAASVQGLHNSRTTQQQQQQQQARGRAHTSPFAAAAEASRSSLRPRAGKRQWPFSASAAGAAATSPANVSAATAAAAAAAAAASGGGAAGAFAVGYLNAAADGMPSAPPLSCLIAEQEQQRLKRQHVMQQQQQRRQNSPAAATCSRQFTPTGSRQQQQQRHDTSDSSQQQPHQQQQQRTRKRSAEGAVGPVDLQPQQQQQQEWRWPTSRGAPNSPVHGWCKVTATATAATAAAASGGGDGCVDGDGSAGCAGKTEVPAAAAAAAGAAASGPVAANKCQHTNTAAAAGVAAGNAGLSGTSVRLPAVKRHAAGDLKAEQQQQQQHGQFPAGVSAAGGTIKRLHVAHHLQQPGQPVAAATAGCCQDAATGDDATVDTEMPQAVLVKHKRSHADGSACHQQQDAAATGDDAKLSGSDHQQQQQQQYHGMKAARLSPAPAAAAAVDRQAFLRHAHTQQAGQDTDDTCDPSSSSRTQLLSALQGSFPTLVPVLDAVQCGGLVGCLQGPCGPATAALLARPAGQQLLQAFVELAGNEALLAAAIHHHQATQQQQQEASMRSPAAYVWQGMGLGRQDTPSTPPSAAAAGATASPIPVRSPALGHALQQLQDSVAEGEVAAAVQLMSSLSLALELQLEGRDVSSALQGAQQQLQQLQQLTSELREKLVLAEQQQEQLQQQREAAAAAAAAELRTTNDQLERALLCQICFEKPKDTVLMPCMHFLYCSGCLAAAKTPGKKAAGGAAGGSKGDGGAVLKCPVCRVPCSGQLVVHLSPV